MREAGSGDRNSSAATEAQARLETEEVKEMWCPAIDVVLRRASQGKAVRVTHSSWEAGGVGQWALCGQGYMSVVKAVVTDCPTCDACVSCFIHPTSALVPHRAMRALVASASNSRQHSLDEPFPVPVGKQGRGPTRPSPFVPARRIALASDEDQDDEDEDEEEDEADSASSSSSATSSSTSGDEGESSDGELSGEEGGRGKGAAGAAGVSDSPAKVQPPPGRLWAHGPGGSSSSASSGREGGGGGGSGAESDESGSSSSSSSGSEGGWGRGRAAGRAGAKAHGKEVFKPYMLLGHMLSLVAAGGWGRRRAYGREGLEEWRPSGRATALPWVATAALECSLCQGGLG